MRIEGIARRFGIAAALAIALLSTGCVAYPAGGGYYAAYSPAPYYAPAPYAVVAPPLFSFWGGGYRGGNGYGHHWH